jgi:hypothetical protein
MKVRRENCYEGEDRKRANQQRLDDRLPDQQVDQSWDWVRHLK